MAATVNVASVPGLTICPAGCVVIEGGAPTVITTANEAAPDAAHRSRWKRLKWAGEMRSSFRD